MPEGDILGLVAIVTLCSHQSVGSSLVGPIFSMLF
jgi:hypothetical protein